MLFYYDYAIIILYLCSAGTLPQKKELKMFDILKKLFARPVRRLTFAKSERSAARAARRAGERRQRDDECALIGKIDQSDPYWADRV